MAENLENLASDNGDVLDPYVVKKKERRRQKAITERIEGEFELNLNAMIDMMTVLVTFLIKNFQSDPISVEENNDLRIVHSTSDLPIKDSVAISITKKSVSSRMSPSFRSWRVPSTPPTFRARRAPSFRCCSRNFRSDWSRTRCGPSSLAVPTSGSQR